MRPLSCPPLLGSIHCGHPDPAAHTLFLQASVLPACIKQGGLLLLSSGQYKLIKPFLTHSTTVDMIEFGHQQRRTIHWSPQASLIEIKKLFAHSLLMTSSLGLLSGRASAYLNFFFQVWSEIGIERLPPQEVPNFSLAQLRHMCSKLPQAQQADFDADVFLENGILKLLKDAIGERSTDDDVNTFIDGTFALHNLLATHLHQPPQRNSIPLDTVLNDLSRVTILECREPALYPVEPEDVIDQLLSKVLSQKLLTSIQSRYNLQRVRWDAKPGLYSFDSTIQPYIVYCSPSTHAITDSLCIIGNDERSMTLITGELENQDVRTLRDASLCLLYSKLRSLANWLDLSLYRPAAQMNDEIAERCYIRMEGDAWVAVAIDSCLAAQGSSFFDAQFRLRSMLFFHAQELRSLHPLQWKPPRTPLNYKIRYLTIWLTERIEKLLQEGHVSASAPSTFSINWSFYAAHNQQP